MIDEIDMIDEAVIPLAHKFEILFETMPGSDGKPYQLSDVADATGLALNSISRLKHGRIEDPRLSTLLLIAAFYDISLDYFACRTEAECLRFLRQEMQRHDTVPEIALRVRAMSADVLEKVHTMMNYIEHLEADEAASDANDT